MNRGMKRKKYDKDKVKRMLTKERKRKK